MQFFVAFSNSARFAEEGMPADFAEVMQEDQARIRQLYAEGTIRDAWAFDRPERGGALLFETDSVAQFDELLASIPFVERDYNDYEIYPLAPFPGFFSRK